MPQLTRRLPNLSGGGATPQHTIDPETWDRIIPLFGRPLPADQIAQLKSDLEGATGRYLLRADVATSAPIRDRQSKQIRKYRQALLTFLRLSEKLQVGDEGDFDTGLIEHHLSHPKLDGGRQGKLTEFYDRTREYEEITREYEGMVRAVAAASKAALKTAAFSGAGLQPTKMWDIWVRETARAWGKYVRPVSVRHDGDPKVSDFVTLIDILQSSLAGRYHHHTNGPTALSSAVARALDESPVHDDFT
ncbi:hypothetical protein [Bradyrhizobium sp. 613_E4_N2_2]|uniref:hypothetical protein n=1 Tax=Bradyrhizobium sp. 613_E4_N2_2 TaxID=3240371 RepID=UPI003F88713F